MTVSEPGAHRMPPWSTPTEPGEPFVCARCGQDVPAYWRHYWPPCRACNVRSFIGVQIFAVLGVNARDYLYDIASPWCADCGGTGYRPCQPQDLSVLRMSGVCGVCDEPSFKLIHATKEQRGDVEGSERHYDPDLDHDHVARTGAGPLVRTLGDYLERTTP